MRADWRCFNSWCLQTEFITRTNEVGVGDGARARAAGRQPRGAVVLVLLKILLGVVVEGQGAARGG